MGSSSLHLQKINSVHHQEQRKHNTRPAKVTCISNPAFEETFSYKTWKNVPNANVFDLYKKSGKKSIEIFLNITYSNPEDPDDDNVSIDNNNVDEDLQVSNASVNILMDPPREKKVTFAINSCSNKSAAEIRRFHFRNSYSKRNNSPCISTEVVENFHIQKNTVESGLTNDSSIIEVTPSSTSSIEQRSSDRSKEIIKRKLKSCKSRFFHKSLNSTSGYASANVYSYVKPLKPVHSEVVTMVSLVTSADSDSGERASKILDVDICSNECNNSRNNESDTRVKVQSANDVLLDGFSTKLIDNQSRMLLNQRNMFSTKTSNLQTTNKSGSALRKKRVTSPQEKLMNKYIHEGTQFFDKTRKELNVSHSGLLEKWTKLSSLKEKECWSSFRKMIDNGVTVSFDTILRLEQSRFLAASMYDGSRGLLTPTEYRLRKNELLLQAYK